MRKREKERERERYRVQHGYNVGGLNWNGERSIRYVASRRIASTILPRNSPGKYWSIVVRGATRR